METKITVQHYKNAINKREDVQEVSFVITSTKPLNPDKIGDIASAYLIAIGIKAYSLMYESEVLGPILDERW